MGLDLVEAAGWRAEFPWLAHGFTTRLGGVSMAYGPGELNLGYTDDDAPEAVAANRKTLAGSFAGVLEMVMVRQVHSAEIKRVGAGAAASMMHEGRAVCAADGLVTGKPGLLLGVMVADCVPVLVADTRARRVAALHAGWQGTAAGIVETGVGMLIEDGSRVEDLVAAIGPSIGTCCYSVGSEVQESFAARFGYADALLPGGRTRSIWICGRRTGASCSRQAWQRTALRWWRSVRRVPGQEGGDGISRTGQSRGEPGGRWA